MKWVVIAIIIFLRIIFSISKAANEKGQKQQQRVQADPGRKQRVQSEIEAFLSEVSGNKQPRKSDSGDAQLEQRRRQQQQRKAEAKRRQREEQQRQKQKAEKRRRVEPQASTSKSRRKGERKVGSGVATHVDKYISQHVSEHINHDVDEYVDATIVDSVEDHLGSRSLEMPTMATSKKSSAAATSIAKMLRNPQGVRNAIIVNEILSRPRALRR
ncbi:MAG TPA: hypothetical protein EYG03_22170 [Planctomycetes bacterium]|nr:hypothetical protein [Fuerstiella sp.]HIK94659.1 hypothetical protein [Planctomycetota bacterium]